jgi:uncharacterized damage-inducible protein DinB
MNDGIRFSELLDYTAEETAHWKTWFAANPSALDLPIDIADAGTVRRLLVHIFFVELHFADVLIGSPVDFQTLQKKIESSRLDTVDCLFALSEEAAGKYREFFSKATAEDYGKAVEFGTRMKLKPTKRKMITQALTHSMRHWAQLATALRQQGFKTDWVHDFLLSKAME